MKRQCYLTLSDESIDLPGVTIDARQLGAPDPRSFGINFRNWLTEPENLKYFYNIVPQMTPELNQLTKDIIQEEDIKLGSFEDSFLGLKETYRNRDLISKARSPEEYNITCDYAVSIMAGPSADDLIPILKEHLKTNPGILILACDAIFRRLLDEGIDPHFVFSSERVECTKQFFNDLPPSKATLVCSQLSTHPLVSFWKGDLCFLISLKPETIFLFPLLNKAPYNPGVAEMAPWFGNFKKFLKIVLLSHDFCFKGGKTHARLLGASHEAVKDSDLAPKVPILCVDQKYRMTTIIYKTLRDTLTIALHKLKDTLKVSVLIDPSLEHQPAILEGTETIVVLPAAPNPIVIERLAVTSKPNHFEELLDELKGSCNWAWLMEKESLRHCVAPLLLKEYIHHQGQEWSSGASQVVEVNLNMIREALLGNRNLRSRDVWSIT